MIMFILNKSISKFYKIKASQIKVSGGNLNCPSVP